MRKLILLVLVSVLLITAIFVAETTQTQAQSAWQPNTAYSVGALVTYNGRIYKCLQAHTSQVGWEPATTAALWQDMGPASGSTATTIPPTKTNTPIPPTTAPTNTTAAIPSATSSAGGSTYEAENATLSNAVLESTHLGFSGTGYVNYNNISGGYVEFNVTVAQTGVYRLVFRFSNAGTADRPMEIKVNGAVVNSNLSFPLTGTWETWQTQIVDATLQAGSNAVRATGFTADGGPNLDKLDVTFSQAVTPTTVPPTAQPTKTNTVSVPTNTGVAPTNTSVPPTPVSGIDTTAWYNVINLNSNKCVDAQQSGTANGTIVQQWTCSTSTNKQWQFQPTDSGYYRVVVRYATTLVWDVSGPSTANNALIHLWTYGGGTNQQWQPQSVGSNTYRFVARNSGRCLNIPAASTTDGTQLQQYDCNNTTAQSFKLVTAGTIPTNTPTAIPVTVSPTNLQVFMMDPNALATLKARIASGDHTFDTALNALISRANSALNVGPYSVMHKPQIPPSGNKHDYMSQARYWWPNPNTADGLPYINKDGQTNPEIYEITDHTELDNMAIAVNNLSLAYYLKGNQSYATKAASLIRAWFLDSATKMNPNMNYAQRIPGVTDGSGYGIIDSREFARVIDDVGLLAGSQAWTATDQANLKSWFSQYLNWLQTSTLGKDEAAAVNNHKTWYNTQAAASALFIGNTTLATQIINSTKALIADQINTNGSQKYEITRADAWHYSNFNIEPHFRLAYIGQRVGIDLWNYTTSDGRSIRKALEFIKPATTDHSKWPYTAGSPWDNTEAALLFHVASISYNNAAYKTLSNQIKSSGFDSQIEMLWYPKLN